MVAQRDTETIRELDSYVEEEQAREVWKVSLPDLLAGESPPPPIYVYVCIYIRIEKSIYLGLYIYIYLCIYMYIIIHVRTYELDSYIERWQAREAWEVSLSDLLAGESPPPV